MYTRLQRLIAPAWKAVNPGSDSVETLKDPIDVYATDRAYWESFHYKPVQE
jgi:hypothetical protein